MGTANYLSPEQVRGEPLTPASDIYSLGLVLIEALTGAPVYPGAGVEAALVRLTRPPSVPSNTSRALRAVLHDMTACDPHDRPDAREAARRLETFARADGARSLTSETLQLAHAATGPDEQRTAGATKPTRRHTLAGASAALLLAGCAALIAILTAAGSTSTTPPSSENQSPQPAARTDLALPRAQPTQIDALRPTPALRRTPVPAPSAAITADGTLHDKQARSNHAGGTVNQTDHGKHRNSRPDDRRHPARTPMIGPRQITSWVTRTLSLDPHRAVSNAAPNAKQRRHDRADQLAAIKRRYGTPTTTPAAPQLRVSDASRGRQ